MTNIHLKSGNFLTLTLFQHSSFGIGTWTVKSRQNANCSCANGHGIRWDDFVVYLW